MNKNAVQLKKADPALVNLERIGQLRNELQAIQSAGAPANPATAGVNACGSPVVRFDSSFAVACPTKDEAEALAKQINDLIRPLITNQHVRLLDELRALASTACDALKKGHP